MKKSKPKSITRRTREPYSPRDPSIHPSIRANPTDPSSLACAHSRDATRSTNEGFTPRRNDTAEDRLKRSRRWIDPRARIRRSTGVKVGDIHPRERARDDGMGWDGMDPDECASFSGCPSRNDES